MQNILNQMSQIEKTLKSGNHPSEMLVHINKKYRDLDEKLSIIRNNIDVIFTDIKN